MPPPPTPFHVLRHHQSPVHHLAFSSSNEVIYSGDEEGNIAVIDLKLRRVVASWKAHEAGVLGVGEWEAGLVSQGRDNVIHFHAPLSSQPEASTSTLSSTISKEMPLTSPDLEPSTGLPQTPNPASSVSDQEGPGQTSKLPPLPFNPTLTRHLLPSTTPLLPPPTKLDSLPTNSLNFCKFAMVDVPEGAKGAYEVKRGKRRVMDGLVGLDQGRGKEGLLAVPNLMDSDSVDIYHLPSLTRLHAAFTKIPSSPTSTSAFISDLNTNATTTAGEGLGMEGETRSALIMGIHLSFIPIVGSGSSSTEIKRDEPKEQANANRDTEDNRQEPSELGITADPAEHAQQTLKLRAILGFEDGRVEAWECRDWAVASDARMGRAQQGGWECRWREKGHNEAIMAMTVSPKLDYAFTVSADHQLIRYNLRDLEAGEQRMSKHSTKQIGNADVKVDPNGKVVAVAGWDGSVRLFSVKSFKSLGTLVYHRETVNTIVFPHLVLQDATLAKTGTGDDEEDDDENVDMDGQTGIRGGVKGFGRWLGTGGKDRRVALWELRDFARRR